MTSIITISEELNQFISEHNDRYALQIMLFFVYHPLAQFNERAIIHGLNQDGERRCISKALGDLVNTGAVTTTGDDNLSLYSLAENLRGLVWELAQLNLCQQQRLLCPGPKENRDNAFRYQMVNFSSKTPDTSFTIKQCSPVNDREKPRISSNLELAAVK